MPLITREMMELQRQLHREYAYGRGVDALECAEAIRAFQPILQAPDFTWPTVLDYGCGQGHLKRLIGYNRDVREYDPCIPGKEAPPEPADIVVCADVLEHIEPECLPDVLHHIRGLTKKRAIFVIATQPSKKIMADGRNAHVICENAEWWSRKLDALFKIENLVDRTSEGKGLFFELKPQSQIGKITAIAAVSEEERMKQIRENCLQTPQRIPDQPVAAHGGVCILCCYGPSLKRTVGEIDRQRKQHPNSVVVSVSGAHDFLRKNHVRPDNHVECDPRAHKGDMLMRPSKKTLYLMASCCHPDVIKKLDGSDVFLWHLFGGEESFKIRQIPSERYAAMIPGGGSVGLRAVVLMYYLGYRNFIVHGFDCSFDEGGAQHAGDHSGKVMDSMSVRVAGDAEQRWFKTAPVLITYAQHMLKDLREGKFPGAHFVFGGDGLFRVMLQAEQAQMRELVEAAKNSGVEPPHVPVTDYFGETAA